VDNRKNSSFKGNEMSTKRVITLLEQFKTYNPNIFHIFYGGEPFMRDDIIDIVRFCNVNDINYTVISNCTNDVQPKIEEVIEQTGLKGLTGSVDPSILTEPLKTHSQMKSSQAFMFLVKMKRKYDIDVVAEVTMTKKSLKDTYALIKLLSSCGIYSSLTAIDINKNHRYDFSAYSDRKHLIKNSRKLMGLYKNLIEDTSLLIHMKDIIIDPLFQHIDSTYDCGMGGESTEAEIHNLTIDADGSFRTCLRLNGLQMNKIKDTNIFIYGHLHPLLLTYMRSDKRNYCRGCNHTCVMMSKYANDNDEQRIINH
jgi:MoaA/NifB/PqqE/SkfB family radical SAM enzyme